MATKSNKRVDDNYTRAVQANPTFQNEPEPIWVGSGYVEAITPLTEDQVKMMFLPGSDPYGVFAFIESGMQFGQVHIKDGMCPDKFYRLCYGFCYSRQLPARPRKWGSIIYFARGVHDFSQLRRLGNE